MKRRRIKTAHSASLVGLIAISAVFVSPLAFAQEIIVDDTSADTSRNGSWYTSVGANPYLGRSLYSNNGSRFYWRTEVPVAGDYDVYAWWTYHANRSNNVPYFIRRGSPAPIEVNVDQSDPSLGGQWNLLGRFSFDRQVTISVAAYNGQASADAIRLVGSEGQNPVVWPEANCPCDAYYSRAIDQYVAWGGSLISQSLPGGAATISCEQTDEHALADYRTFVNGGTSDQTSLLLYSVIDEPGVHYECGVILDSSLHPTNRVQTRQVKGFSGKWSDACMASVLDFCPK